MSTRNPTHGQKVTTENAAPSREGAGAVASDSLAADSTRAGGGFASNRNSEPLGVAGSNSTFANTNTSGATRLDPASDAEARQAQDDWAEEKKLGAASKTYPNALGAQSKATAVTDTTGSHETGGNTSSAGTAPTYVSNQGRDGGGPKGKNLTEGGFESSDENNASFNGDIGGKNDPSRLAEQKMYRENAETEMGAVPKSKGTTGENEFDALRGDVPA